MSGDPLSLGRCDEFAGARVRRGAALPNGFHSASVQSGPRASVLSGARCPDAYGTTYTFRVRRKSLSS